MKTCHAVVEFVKNTTGMQRIGIVNTTFLKKFSWYENEKLYVCLMNHLGKINVCHHHCKTWTDGRTVFVVQVYISLFIVTAD